MAQREKFSMVGSVVRGLGGGRVDHVGQGRLDRLDLHVRRQLDIDIDVVDARDLADQATAGHDLIALLHGVDLALMLLHLLLLRTDQQEVEDDEDEDQRCHLHQDTGAGGLPARGLGKGWSNEHGGTFALFFGLPNPQGAGMGSSAGG